jgi:hypothetical protein
VTTDAVEGEAILARVHRFREAARLAVEAQASVRDRCLALMELMGMVREEADPTIRLWAEQAVWAECKGFLGMDDEALPVPPRSYEAAQRQMRAQGYQQCPHCRAKLATETDLARWSGLRLAEAERRDVQKRAVET